MADDENPEPEYGLVMPFVPVVNVGGPFEDRAYVAGFEMGRLDTELERALGEHKVTIRAENTEQADLIAMRHGFTCVIEESGTEGWVYATFTPSGGESRTDDGPRMEPRLRGRD